MLFMQKLSIQMGSPESPLAHCHLQPQGYHIQTSAFIWLPLLALQPPTQQTALRQQCSCARYISLSLLVGGFLVPLTGDRGALVQIRGRSVKRDLKKTLGPV